MRGRFICTVPSLAVLVVAAVTSQPRAASQTQATSTTAPEPVGARARAAVDRVLPLLQSSAHTWFEKRQCPSCHHQGLGIVAVTLARERGFRIDQALLDHQVRRTTSSPGSRDRYILGEVSINEQIGESYRSVARGVAGAGRSPLTDLQVHMLAGKQHPTGHWNSYSHRPPLEDSEITATAMTIRALQLFASPHRATEFSTRVARARRWLEATARPRSAEERAMTLFGLRWAGAGTAALRNARDRIIADQRKDGGWAQEATRGSDAYATGQALVALNQAGGLAVTDSIYRRGVDFLLRSQQADGTWLVETRRTRFPGLEYFETGFPHGKHQFISYAGSAWAVMALILSLDGSPAPPLVKADPVAPGADPWVGPSAPEPLTPLMTAALAGTMEEMERVMASGADVNAATRSGITALMCASRDPAKVRRLLEAGANPKAAAKSGHTALMLAAGYDGALESVRLLLDRGADPNAVAIEAIFPGATALRNAALRGDAETVRLLLDRGAQVETTVPVGGVVIGGDLKGRMGEAKVSMPLLFAAFAGQGDVVDLLLARGADPNTRIDLSEGGLERTTVLMLASDAGYPDLVRLLLKRGADPNARDKFGLTPLMYAAAAIDRGDTEIIRLLLDAGADPSARTSEGETAQSLAMKYGNHARAALIEQRSRGQD